MAEKEDVKVAESSTEKDEKRVPWENRAKEYERKLKDAEARLQALESAPEDLQQDAAILAEEKKKKLVELAEDPEAFVQRRIAEYQSKKEIPEAEKWLRSQEGFTSDDEVKIVQIINERGLYNQPPLLRAQTAWELVQRERLAAEVASLKQNKTREAKLNNGPEGTGKSAPQSNSPKRSELLKQLAIASKSNNPMAEADIIGKLEDARE